MDVLDAQVDAFNYLIMCGGQDTFNFSWVSEDKLECYTAASAFAQQIREQFFDHPTIRVKCQGMVVMMYIDEGSQGT